VDPHDIGSERLARLATARLYLVCDSRPGGRELLDVLRSAIAGGVDVVQLREKEATDDELIATARPAGALCSKLGALFLINDRPAVALAVGADGVHVGQEDMPAAQVRELLGPDMLIGLSTHAPAEIDAAAGVERTIDMSAPLTLAGGSFARVDYIGVGPVYATPTKPGRPAVGLELVRYAAAHAQLPFFAIGGVDIGNAATVAKAGAQRIAVVRAIADAVEPERAARVIRGTLIRCWG
jgi:thiamine-phosphate pyrophosphorylase